MQPNTQPIEKRVARATTLSVHSIFYTIQGEGPFCGTPAVFVRLAGCNLQCPGCDTDYTTGRKEASVEDVADAVIFHHPKVGDGLVVITGGEPFRQPLVGELIACLVDLGFYVQIETNGTLPPPALPYGVRFITNTALRKQAYIVCSPKAGKVNSLTAAAACAYKYVLHADSVDHSDGLPLLALHHPAAPRVARPPQGFAGPVYLQPMDTQNPFDNLRHKRACVAACLKHGYTLQLQVHKLIGME